MQLAVRSLYQLLARIQPTDAYLTIRATNDLNLLWTIRFRCRSSLLLTTRGRSRHILLNDLCSTVRILYQNLALNNSGRFGSGATFCKEQNRKISLVKWP